MILVCWWDSYLIFWILYGHREYFVVLNGRLFYWVLQKCLFYLLFMVMLGWLRNSLAAVFSWCVNNVGCFLLYLFLMASALRRSQNSGLIEITFLSRNFKIFWYKISISVFLLMLVYPWNSWVKLQSKRLINLSILFGISKWPL